MDRKEAFRKYLQQKDHAKTRGIEWQFSFETWLAWWSDDLDQRGPRGYQLSMQRIGDAGPYHPDNVRKGLPARNAKTRGDCCQRDQSAEAARTLEAARADAMDAESLERQTFDDDDWDICGITFGRGQRKASFVR